MTAMDDAPVTDAVPTEGTVEAKTSGPIKRSSLHDEIVDRLRAMVYEGELEAGEKVPERALCEALGVSRTPLREALKVLASEGLFELAPNRGARVASLSASDIDEMFQVMGVLEALAGELACARLSDEDLAELRALHFQMALHHTRGERADYFRLNQEIHAKLMAVADNAVLTGIYNGLTGRIRRARYQANMSDVRWAEAMAEHEEILSALEARDGPRLAKILKDHLGQTCETLKKAITQNI